MSRRAAIIEEFDDDVDLPLPSRPLPNTGTRGAILQEITDVDDASDDDEALDLVEPTAGPASPQGPSHGTPVVTDITPYKKLVSSKSSHSRSPIGREQMDLHLPYLH